MTGGRFTENTNDLTVGYARAQRDLGCTYSLGFYVDEPFEDRIRQVTVRIKRPGLRAIHAGNYVFRSLAARRESLLRAAFLSPETFETGIVRAHAFPLQPASPDRWDGLLAISFPVPLVGDGEQVREFGAVLHDGPRVAHTFSRSVRLRPERPDVEAEPVITFLEPIELAPGRYELSVVLSDPETAEPHASKVELTLPDIPKRELFLVGPLLGRRAGPNVVVTGGPARPRSGGAETAYVDRVGGEKAFEPLLVQRLERPDDVVALTEVCRVGKKRRVGSVGRALFEAAGESVGELPAVALELDGAGRVHCEPLVDVLPAAAMQPGEYVFEAFVEGRDGDRERVRFAVSGS